MFSEMERRSRARTRLSGTAHDERRLASAVSSMRTRRARRAHRTVLSGNNAASGGLQNNSNANEHTTHNVANTNSPTLSVGVKALAVELGKKALAPVIAASIKSSGQSQA